MGPVDRDAGAERAAEKGVEQARRGPCPWMSRQAFFDRRTAWCARPPEHRRVVAKRDSLFTPTWRGSMPMAVRAKSVDQRRQADAGQSFVIFRPADEAFIRRDLDVSGDP